jgi:type IV fimbrial biogenesis protein FimT
MNTPHHPTSAGQRQLAPQHPGAPAAAPAGFTLVELLVTLAILGLLLVMAVPLASSLGNSMKLTSLSNAFISQLHLARSEAIKRNGRVAICKSGDGQRCAPGGGWEQGWIMFSDTNNNGVREETEHLVQRFSAFPPGFRLAGNLNVVRYVSFGSNGGTRTTGGAFQAGTLTVCKESLEKSEARQIVINAVGRPRIQKVTLPNCA